MLFVVRPEERKEKIMASRKNIVASKENNYYSPTYVTPVVPEGYHHVTGTNWNTGFMIERDKDGSMFTFVPVGMLESNGTLDGKTFREKFGRRKWYPKEADELGQESIYGILNPLWNQLQSIREYGGFYVSSCPISRTSKMDLLSIPSRNPLTMVDFDMSIKLAYEFERSDYVSSHLLFGAEYHTMLEWLIETNAVQLEEITDSDIDFYQCVNNIYGLGEIAEWTQEKTIIGTKSKPAVRGATIKSRGGKNAIAWRQENYKYIKRPNIGFRVALFIA